LSLCIVLKCTSIPHFSFSSILQFTITPHFTIVLVNSNNNCPSLN
jgi:hypothetical protein